MMNTMTMEQLNNELRGRGKAMGRIMNKREMELIDDELTKVEKEVEQEMSNFEMIAKFTQELTMEDVTMITIKKTREEVKEEMERTNDFEMIAEFVQGLTMEDVYSDTTTEEIEHVEAEIVGIVGQDIEVGIAEEDRVDIGFYGTSYATEGIRYIEKLEPLMTW